ncbi:MAG: GtrA family protein [Opitutaceae bacterium]
MLKQDLILKLTRFAIVGALVTGVNSLLIWYFHGVVGLGPRTSFWAAYFPAVIVHFSLTKWWTFRCQRRDLLRQLGHYALAAVVSATVQFAVFQLALEKITPNPNLAYLIAAAFGMGLSFALMQWKVFAADPIPPG